MACSKEAFRIILWMCFVTVTLISTIYWILSAVTFYKLLAASSEAAIDPLDLVKNKIWRAPLAATILGALLVFGFNTFSCIFLIKKSVNRSGPGFGYGFMVAFCFTLSIFCLLCGLIQDGYKDVVKENLQNNNGNRTDPIWTKYSTELYTGAEVFAFVCFAAFLIFFLILVILQGAVSDQLGIARDMANPYAPMEVPAAGALLAQPVNGGGASDAPQYQTEYAADGTYNQYYQAQDYNNGQEYPADYQNTTEYKAQEYNYDQEQGGYQNNQYQYQSDYNTDANGQGAYNAQGGYQQAYTPAAYGNTAATPQYRPVEPHL